MATVKEIQTVLKKEGFYTGLIDGVAGQYTIKAIRLYQAYHKLVIDGQCGPITQAHMGFTKASPTPTSTFMMGYYINRTNTPLENISWTGLKAKGITEVYIRCVDSNVAAISKYLPAIKAAGLKPYAWTMEGLSGIQNALNYGWNICHDFEIYDMQNHYQDIKNIQTAVKAKGKTFILCTKAQDWDGDQKWSVIKDYCDYLQPMLYLGDYGKTVAQLAAYMKAYNTKYPGKIMPVLETYKSDANPVAKDRLTLQAEINACKPYCKGIGLFRYGITNL